MTILREHLDDSQQGWCGVGALTQFGAVWHGDERVRGAWLKQISRHSDLAKVQPPLGDGDMIVAVKDERYGEQWVPMRMIETKTPLPNGAVPELVGPQDTKVQFRIRRSGGQMIEVEAIRGAFDVLYDEKDTNRVIDIVRSRNASMGCVMSEWQGDPLPPLRKLAGAAAKSPVIGSF